ncbi:MAG: TonB-dependent receptor [Steroidobacteraceae bacterium]
MNTQLARSSVCGITGSQPYRNASIVLGSLLAFSHVPALAATSNDGVKSDEVRLEEIVVTAQKRSESINSVPMSISAMTGDQLLEQGIANTSDLAKVIPGFTFAQSAYSAPVYSLRGVGFYDYSIGAAPTVSVYVDEAPLPFSTMTRGAGFDLQRVEVLKGPQGTLFGSNSTGGAVNYIAARPGKEFEAGVDASYGNYSVWNVGGFVSGPLAETLSARVALRHEGSGNWQYSSTRNEKLGSKDFTQGRFVLDWRPSDSVRTEITLSGFNDKSDAQAAQLVQVNPLIPPFVSPALSTLPLANQNARVADWTAGLNPSHDDTQFQSVARIDYDIQDNLTLTSLTSYSHYKQNDVVDPDGTALKLADTVDVGTINAFSEELRLSGESGSAHWIVGGIHESNRVYEAQYLNASDASGFRSFNIVFSVPTPDATPIYATQRFKTSAAFGNLDYDLGDRVTVHGGVRYTKTNITFDGCTGNSGNGGLGQGLSIILGSLSVPVSFPPGSCTTLDANLQPGISHQELDQNNVSWRAGVDFKPAEGKLLYLNISKGYKSGSFPTLPTTSTAQNLPASQEGLLAYEAGFKLGLLDHTLQVDGAVFYYDYSDKQIQGSVVLNPNIFGPLNNLINIPKSSVKGAELQVNWTPVRGLKLSVGGTYLKTYIDDFTNFDPYGVQKNFKGESFPNTPKWQAVADAQYTWSLSNSLNGFGGGGLTYHSRTNSALGEYEILGVNAYTLLDLRAGVASSSDKWRLTLWGRNVTNKYYWSNAYKIADITSRFTGMPATYGASISVRF